MQLRSYSVGITTLEEVFLKIGHGEDDAGHDVGAGAPDAYRQLPDLNSDELEDYSIAKEANKSFCGHEGPDKGFQKKQVFAEIELWARGPGQWDSKQ